MPPPAHGHHTCAAVFTCGSIPAITVDTPLISKGDAHEKRLETREALNIYLEAEKQQPDNPALLVRIARQYRHLLADARSVPEKVKLGNTALAYSKRAAAAAPSHSDAQLASAITYGKLLPYMSKKEQVATSRLIKASAERAIKLDPQNDLAWHVLGRWHRNAAAVSGVKRALASIVYESLPPSSNDEAVRCLERAVKLAPHRLMHQIELGRAYAQAGRPEEARRHLSKGVSMPSQEHDDPALKAAGRTVLASLK